MRRLSQVIAAKIAITIGAWSVPLLFFPSYLLVHLGFPAPRPEVFLRLLGMAYLALVVGYAFGYRQATSCIYPREAVWMGIVSNGGATVVLTIAAISGAWSGWGPFAQAYMWISLVCVALITAGLTLFGPCRTVAEDSGD